MTFRSWLLVIAGCALVTLALGWFKYQQIQTAIARGAAYPEAVESVEVVAAVADRWQPTTTVTGEVVALRSVDLRTELAGRIIEVGFAGGAAVRRGQVLVRLDVSEESARLAAAQADAELARLDLVRAEKLIASRAGTEENRDQARARQDAALALVRQLEAMIDKKTLRAPFDARAGLHVLEAGQYLDAGALVTRLIGTADAVWIDFTLPQEQVGLDVGDAVSVRVDGDPTGERRAEVVARDAAVSETSRNLRYRARCADPDADLRPGMLVRIELPAGPERTATLVPATSVRRDAFGATLYVLRPAEAGARAAERAERRSVRIGAQRGDQVVVTAGVEPGERVAANGAFKLREGVLVTARDVGAGS
ncbi:MAG TPA: efflux RND transporter periplasmic adaptor subunit [Pseudomonadales bacterium]|nr:efflux RND transporter periplasmic adaptor subunit [Pseudomonadales bacterium]